MSVEQATVSHAELLDSARHWHESGQWTEALAAYDILLKFQPEHQEVRLLRAIACLQLGMAQAALETLQAAHQANGGELASAVWLDILAQCGQTEQARQWLAAQGKLKGMSALLARHFRLGGALQFPDQSQTSPAPLAPPGAILLQRCDRVLAVYQSGRYLTAWQEAWSLIGDYPRDVFGWKLLGAILSTMRLWHGAQAAMQQALRIQPADTEVLNNLGMLFAQIHQPLSALRCLQEAVRLQPDRYSIQVNLGCVLNDLDRLTEAESCLRQAMALAPAAVECLNNLGNVLRRQGRYEEASSLLRRSIALHPDKAGGWNNLGCVLRDQQQFADAEPMFLKALEIAPGQAEIVINLAAVLQRQHRFEPAETLLVEALRRSPLDAALCRQLAWLRRQSGQEQEALAPYLAALALAPDHPVLLTDLAAQLLALMRPAEAEVMLCRALLRQPGQMIAYNHLSLALRQQGRLVEAREVLLHGLTQQPDHAETLSNLGTLLAELGEVAEAERLLMQALQAAPRQADIAINLAELYQVLGRDQEAEALIGRALSLAQPHERPQILSSAMMMLPLAIDDPRLKDAEALYAHRAEWAKTEQIKFNMALGKVREKSSLFAAAFAAYQEGNALQAALQPFDVEADEQLFATIRAFYTPALLDRWADRLPANPHDDRLPVFIVGMPRSGTSLVEQILSSHPAVYGGGESMQMNAFSAEGTDCLREKDGEGPARVAMQQLAGRYVDAMWQAAPHARIVTDKMPENFLHLGLVSLLLPQARIIHCERSPMDTCFSCHTTPFRIGHAYRTEQTALAGRFLRYRALMQYWQQTLPAGRMLTVRYESLVSDPVLVVRQMLDFLGLPWHDDCLKFYQTQRPVRTASVSQVRQPLYDRSVGRWRRFEPWLSPLLTLLGDLEADW